MAYDKEQLIAYRIQRARDTVEEVKMAIEHGRFPLAENRMYYSMFYMVMALAITHDYSTSKHTQLLGWFNKEFVRTGQVDMTLAGRVLLIVVIYFGQGKGSVVTARNMTDHERRRFSQWNNR